jgi:hypothetical protein
MSEGNGHPDGVTIPAQEQEPGRNEAAPERGQVSGQ